MNDFGEDSLHDRMHCYIELAWICSTGLGILLFLVQVSMSLSFLVGLTQLRSILIIVKNINKTVKNILKSKGWLKNLVSLVQFYVTTATLSKISK